MTAAKDPLAKLGSHDLIAALTGVAVTIAAYEGMSRSKALFEHMTSTSLLGQLISSLQEVKK